MSYTIESITAPNGVRIEAYSANGYYLGRCPDYEGQPEVTTWQLIRDDQAIARYISWCTGRSLFLQNTGIDLGNLWGNCDESTQAGLDWADWTNSKPADKEWTPNEGQCICQIHLDYYARYGMTVNQFYEANPHLTQEWMQRCGNCAAFFARLTRAQQEVLRQEQPQAKPAKQEAPAPVEQTPKLVYQAPAPVEEMPGLVETWEEQAATQEAPTFAATWEEQAENAEAPPVAMEIARPANSGLSYVGVAVLGAVVALALGAAVVSIAPIAAAALVAWKLKGPAWRASMAALDVIGDIIFSPLMLARRERRQNQTTTYRVVYDARGELPAPTATPAPMRLLETKEVDVIEVVARPAPIKVKTKR